MPVIDHHAEYRAIDIAYHFLQLAKNDSSFSNDISNMKLNKLVYFAQVMHVCAYKKALYSEDTRAWDYGPIIPQLYRLLKPFGGIAFSLLNSTITEAFRNRNVVEITDQRAISSINSIWEALKDLSAGELSRITHRPESPWSEVYAKTPYAIISLELMYLKRFGSK